MTTGNIRKIERTAIFSVLIIVVVLWTGWLDSPSISANPHVIGNPQEIRYEGSGGLILPTSVHTEERSRMAYCRDCSWKMTPACVPSSNNYCDAAIRSCPGLIDHVRTWFRPADGDWVETGLICLTTYQITTVADIESQILESFHQYVPPLRPRCWPTQGAIVRLPYICESGQTSEARSWSHFVSGFQINISATPRWTWNFHGSQLRTGSPGGPFPDLSVSHTFVEHGNRSLNLVSRWEGSFTVGDLGPFPIDRRLEQSRSWVTSVGEARGKLMRPG